MAGSSSSNILTSAAARDSRSSVTSRRTARTQPRHQVALLRLLVGRDAGVHVRTRRRHAYDLERQTGFAGLLRRHLHRRRHPGRRLALSGRRRLQHRLHQSLDELTRAGSAPAKDVPPAPGERAEAGRSFAGLGDSSGAVAAAAAVGLSVTTVEPLAGTQIRRRQTSAISWSSRRSARDFRVMY